MQCRVIPAKCIVMPAASENIIKASYVQLNLVEVLGRHPIAAEGRQALKNLLCSSMCSAG